jgi:hypothetical protein
VQQGLSIEGSQIHNKLESKRQHQGAFPFLFTRNPLLAEKYHKHNLVRLCGIV